MPASAAIVNAENGCLQASFLVFLNHTCFELCEGLASSWWSWLSCSCHQYATIVTLGYGFLLQVGIALKPFLPQLQTTFTKALQDSNRGVRLKAADALGKLISIHIKVDPLFTELLNGIRVMEDPGVR